MEQESDRQQAALLRHRVVSAEGAIRTLQDQLAEVKVIICYTALTIDPSRHHTFLVGPRSRSSLVTQHKMLTIDPPRQEMFVVGV